MSVLKQVSCCLFGKEWQRFGLSVLDMRYFSALNNINKIQDHNLRLKQKNSKWNKNKKILSLKRPSISNDVDDSLRREIGNAKSSSNVLDILLCKNDEIIDPSVYGKAMQKCDKLRDWYSVIKIMNILINNKKLIDKISIVEFNIFFNAMTHSDSEKLMKIENAKYFDIMINKFNLKPNIIIFSTLIKGCRGSGNLSYYHLAEKYFNLMINEYKLSPNSLIYTEMISVYSKNLKNNITDYDVCKNKAIELFIEYLKKMQKKQIQKDLCVFGAYLNIFTQIGDIDGINNAFSLIKENKFECNHVIYGNVMNGFLNAKKPRKCIEKFNEFEKELLLRKLYPNNTMYQFQCIALSNIIQFEHNKLTFNQKFEIYKELKTVINQHRLWKHPNIVSSLLSSIIILYHNKNPQLIVKIFELFVKKQLLGYYGYSNETQNVGEILIDLHGFQFIEIQFILLYIFGYKLQEWNVDDIYYLKLIVGKRSHSLNATKGLKEFVIEQLSTYNPPILCDKDERNEGVLLIHKDQLLHYVRNKMNFARHKLTIPSNNWYFGDDRSSLLSSTD